MALQAVAEDSGDYLALLPGFLCFGLSLALVYAPMSTAAMAAMPRSKAGIASGVLAMTRVLAGAVLLAMSGAVFQAALPEPSHGHVAESGYADAVARAFIPGIADPRHRHGAHVAARARPGRARRAAGGARRTTSTTAASTSRDLWGRAG